MMLRRRRPLLRAAMIGGAGYAGYRAGQRASERSQHEAEQDAELTRVAERADATAAPAPTSRAAELAQLKELLDAGVLSPEEFGAEKRRVLSGG
jgi:hypothetical protein